MYVEIAPAFIHNRSHDISLKSDIRCTQRNGPEEMNLEYQTISVFFFCPMFI